MQCLVWKIHWIGLTEPRHSIRKISKFEDKAIEIFQNDRVRKKTLKINEQSSNELWDKFRWPNIRVLEGNEEYRKNTWKPNGWNFAKFD